MKCISVATNGNHFNILAPITDEWIEWFIKQYDVSLCELYLPPFNFKRTGCMGCPFNKNIKQELQVLKLYSPITYEQCWNLWKTIYEEYKSINYRLTNE